MPDITISTDEKKEQPKATETDIKKILTSADEYQKLKEQNDKLEAEYLRQQELKAKIAMGGKALAGQAIEKTPQEIAKEEAAKILSIYR